MDEPAATSPRPEPWLSGTGANRTAGSRTLLFTCTAGWGKLACGIWMLVISRVVSEVPAFANGVLPNVTLEEGASGLLRFCACDVRTDPLGRNGKKRGVLTSDALCSACHGPPDLVESRHSLSRASPSHKLPEELKNMSKPTSFRITSK